MLNHLMLVYQREHTEMMSKWIIGYRVKNADNTYVFKSYLHCPAQVFAQFEKPPVLCKSDALRLLASWLDCGYKGRVVRVICKADVTT